MQQRNQPSALRDPEPDLLEEVSRVLLWPLAIFCVECRLAGGDVGVVGADPPGALEDLPEGV